MTAAAVSFNNTESAFAYKSDRELKKARFLFRSMGMAWLVRLGTRLTPWAIRSGLPVKGLIRNTLFSQFVGGETLEETAAVARTLGRYEVDVILDYGVEGGEDGENGFDHACDEFVRVIEYAATQPNIPFMSIKVTGFARFALLEKLDSSVATGAGSLMKRYAAALALLNAAETREWERVVTRFDRICIAAAAHRIGVLVDAEETWIQDPVDVLSIQMMDKYNRNRVVVYNTVQHYRHDRLGFLSDMFEAARQRDFVLGVKLVRGAYMEKERNRAAAENYASPIQPDKTSTDRDYDAGVAFCLDHLDHMAAVFASHNEDSNALAVAGLRDRGLAANHPHVHFSQLYGMSDNITFNLARFGCSVSKYLPFGPIADVVPYLMRRAEENSSLSGQTGRELFLIERELERRRGKTAH